MSRSEELARHAAAALSGTRNIDERDRAVLEFGVAASAAVLDEAAMAEHARAARQTGVTSLELTECLVTVSVLGFHSLTSGFPVLADVLRQRGEPVLETALDERRVEIRTRLTGEDAYWNAFEERLPGFLDGLLRLAPDAFELFFAYSALPWRSGHLAPKLKEQIYVAIDATPGHVYEPGLLLHAANARRLGTTDAEFAEVLVIAARGEQDTLQRSLAVFARAA